MLGLKLNMLVKGAPEGMNWYQIIFEMHLL